MHCPHCNQEHPDDSQYCPLTGKPIRESVQAPASGPAAPIPPAAQPAPQKTRKGFPRAFWLIPAILTAVCAVLTTAAVLAFTFWKGASQGQAVPAGSSQAGPSGRSVPSGDVTGRIAFVSNRTGTSEIYVMDATDGANQTRLTNSAKGVHNDYPAWSPDGSKIAFVSDRGGDAEIYVMNADGSQPTLLRDIPSSSHLPSLSTAGDFHPEWSPDGQKIAFVSNLDGLFKICVMGADGGHPACIPNSQVGDLNPGFILRLNSDYSSDDEIGLSWCENGQAIAYSSNRSGNFKVYVISLDGGSQTSPINIQTAYTPNCSSDGLKMAFVSYKRPGWGIDWMDFAGGSPTAVIHDNQGSCTSPSWSPDGERIVFQSYRDGNPEIYRINIDGSDLTRLTNDPAKDFHPAWSPATQ